MSRRVVVIGRVPDADRLRTSFPELRTESLALALREAGHPVRVIGLVPPREVPMRQSTKGWERTVRVGEEAPGWLERIAGLAAEAELLVSAGPHNSGRAACLVAGERPVWADLPGDPFAEVQAVSLATGLALPDRQAGALAAAMPLLCRADGIGVIGHRQRLLLLGQLGLLGRLSDPAALPVIGITPVAWSFEGPARAPRSRAAGEPLRVALVGGANAWLDVQAMIAGLELAMGQQPGIEVLVGEGDLPGHYRAGWELLRSWAQDRAGVQLLPRLNPTALSEALTRAHLGLLVDREGLEPETGSRTRVLFLLHQGLEVLSTTRTELCAGLADRELLHPLLDAQPESIAQALLERFASTSGPQAERAAALLSNDLRPQAVAAPLLAFAARPHRATPVPHLGLDLAQDNALLRDELAKVHDSPTWRLSARWRRLFSR